MTKMPQQLRNETLKFALEIVNAGKAVADTPVGALIALWLKSLDDEDLADTLPESLAPVLVDGFTQAAHRTVPGAQIATLRYADGRGGNATALLILNDDMPYLVDSIVMVLRRQKVQVNGVLNAVLPVTRNAAGNVVAVGEPGAKLESYVLCLLADEPDDAVLRELAGGIEMVARDAAVVKRDLQTMKDRFTTVAGAVQGQGDEGAEAAAFLQWARDEGFEVHGYAYYHVKPGTHELERDLPSRIGVLQDTAHSVYGTCLANIPGDLDTLNRRGHILSIVKADAGGTLHRDQQLDFIGVRAADANGNVLGEHCFIGLFTRAAMLTPLARLPFARGRIAQVLKIANLREDGFRAEKFIEILESLPRTEALEAEPEWLAEVCSAVVSLYKQPRTKVFARRDVYARHLNVLVYLPRERYSASVAQALTRALQESSGASHVSSQTLVADGPLARLYLIAHAARYPLDLESDVQRPLLSILDGWHEGFSELADAVPDEHLRNDLRRLCATLPVDYVAATSPAVAFHDLEKILRNGVSDRATVRIELASAHNPATTIRIYTLDKTPTLSSMMPALHNAGVLIDRERAHTIRTNDGQRHYVTSLAVDATSAEKLARPGVASVAEDLFAALFNDDIEDGRLNGLVVEGGLNPRQVQLVRAYMSYWRQTGTQFSVRYIAESLR
ncbi:MAG TPA: glutamate dehydrogenase, partial [Pseudoduganella sp.]